MQLLFYKEKAQWRHFDIAERPFGNGRHDSRSHYD
jgi:hypothetical protein